MITTAHVTQTHHYYFVLRVRTGQRGGNSLISAASIGSWFTAVDTNNRRAVLVGGTDSRRAAVLELVQMEKTTDT